GKRCMPRRPADALPCRVVRTAWATCCAEQVSHRHRSLLCPSRTSQKRARPVLDGRAPVGPSTYSIGRSNDWKKHPMKDGGRGGCPRSLARRSGPPPREFNPSKKTPVRGGQARTGPVAGYQLKDGALRRAKGTPTLS